MRLSVSKYIAVVAAFAVFGCGKKKEENNKSQEKQVNVSATALALAAPKLHALAGQMLLAGPKSPSYADGEYDGMGVLSSDAQVDSLKIILKSVTFQNKDKSANALNFEEKELEISGGVNETVSLKGSLHAGKWDRVAISFKPFYKIKAYAYMDTNNDGTIDTTVYTTPTEVKKAASRLTAAEMTAAGYGEYKYGFAYQHCSDSATDSKEGNCGTISVFPEPFDTEAPPVAEEGEAVPTEYNVHILIDSTKITKAWTGTVGDYMINGAEPTTTTLGNTARIPHAVGFMLSNPCQDSSTKNQWGLGFCDFYKIDTPAFKLEYLPAFAFLGTKNLSSQIYLVSTEDGVWNHYNTGVIQLVFKNQKPLLGLANSPLNMATDSNKRPITHAAPIFGSVARMFEETAAGSGTYTFYMDHGSSDSNGNHDGGLYYNNDKTMAGYIVEGFKPLAVGATSTITIKDGPRCKGEYDYCLGTRTQYIKRFK